VNEATAGHYFWLKVKDSSEAVFASLAAVAQSFVGEDLLERQMQVVSTRKLWDSCKMRQAVLKNDAFAVALALQNSLELIDDAISEVGTSTEWEQECCTAHEEAPEKDQEIVSLARELIQGFFAFLIFYVERDDSTPETVQWLDRVR